MGQSFPDGSYASCQPVDLEGTHPYPWELGIHTRFPSPHVQGNRARGRTFPSLVQRQLLIHTLRGLSPPGLFPGVSFPSFP